MIFSTLQEDKSVHFVFVSINAYCAIHLWQHSWEMTTFVLWLTENGKIILLELRQHLERLIISWSLCLTFIDRIKDDVKRGLYLACCFFRELASRTATLVPQPQGDCLLWLSGGEAGGATFHLFPRRGFQCFVDNVSKMRWEFLFYWQKFNSWY